MKKAKCGYTIKAADGHSADVIATVFRSERGLGEYMFEIVDGIWVLTCDDDYEPLSKEYESEQTVDAFRATCDALRQAGAKFSATLYGLTF